MFKKHLDTFHTSVGMLTYWNSFNYILFCMFRFVETSIKMESKLREFGMGHSKCNTKWDLKVLMFHAMAHMTSQQWHIHHWWIFLLSLDMCFVFCLQNLLSYLTWIGKYGLVYIACHEVVRIHWQDLRWRRGWRCLWICVLDIMI